MYKESYSIHRFVNMQHVAVCHGIVVCKEIWFATTSFLLSFCWFSDSKTILKVILLLLYSEPSCPLDTHQRISIGSIVFFYRVFVLVMAGILVQASSRFTWFAPKSLHIPRWINLDSSSSSDLCRYSAKKWNKFGRQLFKGNSFSNTVSMGKVSSDPATIRMLSISEGLAISLETRASTDFEQFLWDSLFSKRDSVFLCLFLTFYLYTPSCLLGVIDSIAMR